MQNPFTPFYEVPAILNAGHHYVILKLAEKLIFKIPFGPQENILEVGCRDGKISTLLAIMNPHSKLTCLTTSEAYMNQIQNDETLKTLQNVTFHNQDLHQFYYPNQFDKVVSFSCLTWFENKDAIFKNIYAALKSSKKAYLQFFVDHRQDWFDECRLQVATQPKWQPHFKDFKLRKNHPKPGEICFMAEQIGFIIENSQLQKHKILLPNEIYFKNWLKSISAHFIQRLQEKSEEFFSEVVEQYLKTHPKNELDQICYEDYFLELILLKPE